MTKARIVHRCSECGTSAAKWAGRCPGCGEWNTLEEEVALGHLAAGSGGAAGVAGSAADVPTPLTEIDPACWVTRPTGIGELDRVLGGGLVAGSVTLLGGEPGIGKSTLLLQALASLGQAGARCLLVSAEESKAQVRLRAERLGALQPTVWMAAETVMPHLLATLDAVAPDVVVVDSIQTVVDPDLGSVPGSVAQVRGCAARLVQEAKARGTAVVLVGHVTKEGTLAGPRVLEHLVDTVLAFEGERHHALRMLRAVKHRFGPTGELGLFEMTDTGLAGVEDPSGLFLGDRSTGVPGSVVVPTLEGQRPLLVEVQALVAPSDLVMPRRLASGLDANRLALLAAVLHRRVGLSLAKLDVYASAVGGVRLTEPAADLALGLALASAATDVAVPDGLVVCGEVGLAGELRQVAHTQRRLAEAARLGFHRAVVPASAPDPPPGVAVTRVATLAEAVVHLGLRGHGPAGERRGAAEGRAPAERRRSAGERPTAVELPVEGAGTGPVAPSPRRRWAANGAVA